MNKKIDWRKPKYKYPAILYPGLLLIGYLMIDLFGTEIEEKVDTGLTTTEYLNAELPSANLRDDIGGKRENVEKVYGNIRDRSAMQSIETDIDSLKKKEDFGSRYSDEEYEKIRQDSLQREREERLKAARDRLNQSARRGQDLSSDEFLQDLTPEERQKMAELRKQDMMNEFDRDLNMLRQRGGAAGQALADAAAAASQAKKDSIKDEGEKKVGDVEDDGNKPVRALDEDAQDNAVVKKVKETTDYFNTLSVNENESHMIKAIIDEEVKAVDGTRVRLRLLDEIQINDVVMKKGSYLYCTMSGFGSQRVKGKIESILVGDELYKVSLSIFDTDGLEGLYVPQSQFRETAKDVGSQALNGSMNINDGMNTSTSVTQWAATAMQQAYQRTSQAIAKAIKKNKVRLKYGTQVFLVNGQQKKSGSGGGSRGGNRNNRK